MQGLLRLSAWIDRVSTGVGRAASWLALLMVLIGAFNAVARYVGRWIGMNFASNAFIEAQWYLFSLLFLLGGAWTLRDDDHVRVDVLYGRLAPKKQAWIDLLGALLFLLPFCAFALVTSWPALQSSWAVLEGSPDPGGLPRYPLKTMLPVAFGLLALQGASQAIKAVARIRGLAP